MTDETRECWTIRIQPDFARYIKGYAKRKKVSVGAAIESAIALHANEHLEDDFDRVWRAEVAWHWQEVPHGDVYFYVRAFPPGSGTRSNDKWEGFVICYSRADSREIFRMQDKKFETKDALAERLLRQAKEKFEKDHSFGQSPKLPEAAE